MRDDAVLGRALPLDRGLGQMPHRGISRTVHSVKWQKLFGRVKQRPRQAKQWNLFQ